VLEIARRLRSARGGMVRAAEGRMRSWAAIGPHDAAGRRFAGFGDGSIVCSPQGALLNEGCIAIGARTMIGPHVTLSAGMAAGQPCAQATVVSIGDRCVIGRGSAIVGHLSIAIGDDVWTGHHVYVTDQNHDYRDLDLPIGRQMMAARPVWIGDGSWLGHGVVILPGAHIGRHVVIAANSVVSGEFPDFCVAAGAPAVVVRRWESGGWRKQPEGR
jgi:acetyltransferase-like isoleucine patch superfamily enzyme